MTTEEGNKLIAAYMGVEWRGGIFHMNNTYDEDWNELMPVIGKISGGCEEPEELDGLKYALLCNDIDTAYDYVVDYIQENPTNTDEEE